MTVIKRDKSDSSKDLITATQSFIELLEGEGEDEDAVADLTSAIELLQKGAPGTKEHKEAVTLIVDAFDGDHELNAYILKKGASTEWTIADQLSEAASRVNSLARRLR
jgi:hypothetical protein